MEVRAIPQSSDVSIRHWVHPRGNQAFARPRLSPEIEICVSAKARIHRGKPGGVACLGAIVVSQAGIKH
jgi:hypothetical protein